MDTIPKDVKELSRQIESYVLNPPMIQRAIHAHLDHITDGKLKNIDPTHPFGALLEAACVLTSGFISKDYALTRRQYPAAATTEEELYLHMCDIDFLDRFALPSRETFSLIFDEDEIRSLMVEDDVLGIRKLVIPRNTDITVGDVSFSIEYPIEIRELNHGGLQVLWDLSELSPLSVPSSNVIEWELNRQRKVEKDVTHLVLKIPVRQLSLTSHVEGVTLSVPIDLDIALKDDYHYARVYYKDQNDAWVEMLTTHQPDIYDIDKPTAVLKVTQNNLNVRVPMIYAKPELVSSKIRVDVYETLGDLTMNLSGYSSNEFKVTWSDGQSDVVASKFSAPLRLLSKVICLCDGVTTGGRDALSFEELKRRVKLNSYGPKSRPITNVEIEDHLRDDGFTIVKGVDHVTNRIFYASRSLPEPRNRKLITAAASSMETLLASPRSLVESGNCHDNGSSLTLVPGTIYESINGVLKIVPKSTVEHLLRLNPDTRSVEVNKRHYYYTPFHYVLDFKHERFDLRAYYLDSPKMSTKQFSGINDSTLLDVSIEAYTIQRTDQGYRIDILTKSSETVKSMGDNEIEVQMYFTPRGEQAGAYLTGQYLGRDQNRERLFRFDIETNYHLNEVDELVLTNFKMHNRDYREVLVSLTQDMNFLFFTRNQLGDQWKKQDLDDRIARYLVSDNPILAQEAKAIIEEKIRIDFGKALRSLWRQARSVVSTEVYETYPEDIYATYQEDIIDRSQFNSGIRVSGSQVEIAYLHRRGDFVMKDGAKVLLHRRGDVKLGENGKPIIKDPRGLWHQIDLMMIEGTYYFATDAVAKDYRREIVETYLDWMIDGLESVNQVVLEQTKVYFYPRATLGQIDVMYNNGIRTRIQAAQSLNVGLVVSKNVYANVELREQIRVSTIKVIDALLSEGTISGSDIMTALTNQYGEDVLGIELNGLGGRRNVIAMSILDDSKRCSLKKRLTLQSDNSLIVEEDVTVDFIRHS